MRTTTVMLGGATTALAIGLVISMDGGWLQRGATAAPPPPLKPQPIATPGFPTPAATVNGWVTANDQAAIRAHGWALWAGMAATTPASGGWPIWETWYTDTEVTAGPSSKKSKVGGNLRALRAAGRPVHTFERLRQFRHSASLRRFTAPLAALSAGGDQVIGFNKFNADYADFVWANGYYDTNALWNAQLGWPPSTPAVQRTLKPFPAPAVSLKPVFVVARGPNNQSGITVLNYWLGDLTTGPKNSTNPSNPTPSTWKQCVVVNSGSSATPSGLTCPNGGAPAGTIGIDKFFNFALSKEEAKSICSVQPEAACPVQEGDFALLVAMHVSTKEDDNWTWQTFWWNYNQPFPYGPPPAAVPAPFNNYAMCTAYSMTVNPVNSKTGTNVLCYNPYLETGLTGVTGVQSNCMSCHGVASYGNNPHNPGYPSFANMSDYISATVPADDVTYFDCQTQTDFSWFLADLPTQPPPKPQPPCTTNPAPPVPPKAPAPH